ncbi:MAG: hypothetical protein ACXVEF_27640 [Polyangiales bacterium]
MGRWKCTHTKVEEADKKEQPADVIYTFNSDGTYRLQINYAFMGMDKTYKYSLDGRNVITDSPHGTYRIEALSGATLDLFNYDATTTWYLARQ